MTIPPAMTSTTATMLRSPHDHRRIKARISRPVACLRDRQATCPLPGDDVVAPMFDRMRKVRTGDRVIVAI